MDLPDHCIRGISDPSCLLEEGTLASANLFAFPSKGCRADGWIAESINWMDNEHVIDFTLSQTKEGGELQFKVGVAILPRSEVDRLKKRHPSTTPLGYERKSIEGNDYHGNILLKNAIPPHVKQMIRAALAYAARIERQPGT